MKRSKKTFKKAPGIVIYVILFTWSLMVLLPLYWMFVTSLSPTSALVSKSLIPQALTLKNFKELFEVAPIGRWLFNSVFITFTVTLLSLLFDSMAGYAFAILKPTGSNAIFALIIGCLMVPGQIRLVPVFQMVNDLGWYDSYAALILPFIGTVYGTFLMKQYMQGLPWELIECARLDGCSVWKIFVKIVCPLSVPVFAVDAIFIVVGTWNGIQWPLILTSSTEMRILPLGISTLQGQFDVNYGIMMAGAVITAIPIITMFFALQKYFVRGITIGAVKG